MQYYFTDDCYLDSEERVLYRANEPVRYLQLTAQEMDILLFLCENSPLPREADYIYKAIRPDDTKVARYIDSIQAMISKIRRKMKEANYPVEINSKRGSGYYIKLKCTEGAESIVETDKKAISEFSPDGKLLARAKYNEISIYDNSTDQCLFILHGHPDCIDQLFFSPDGKLIHSVSEQEKRTWDLKTGECLSVLKF